jgi:hypothetical protein
MVPRLPGSRRRFPNMPAQQLATLRDRRCGGGGLTAHVMIV